MRSDAATLGTRFATALAARDFETIAALLHPEVDFRAMTPRRFWEASDPRTVVDEVLTSWFEDSHVIERIEALEAVSFSDRARIGLRLSVTNSDGRFLVEQQAFVGERDGLIGFMRVMCSGLRPAAP